MTASLDFYMQQAATFSSLETSIPWVRTLREKGRVDLAKKGFPNRHHEDWKYTALDGFAKQGFTTSAEAAFSVDAGALPAGVIVTPLVVALEAHADMLRPYLGQILDHEHGFQALNTAMLSAGIFIYIPAGVVLEHPIFLSHAHSEPNTARYFRHVIVAEPKSSVHVVESYKGDDTSYFTNTMTEIYAAGHASVMHYKLQQEGSHAYHVGHVAVKQAAHSYVESHSFSLGGAWVRSDTSVLLAEEQARCLLNGVYAPRGKQHVDHHTRITHDVPHCYSEQDYKGILSDQSRAVFNGQVIVVKDAQHTEARQQNKNLLLSSGSEIDTKPQLDIYANDVVCTHGATVGQLDEDALFYLAARGISEVEAKRWLVRAFVQENVERIVYLPIAESLQALFNTYMESL